MFFVLFGGRFFDDRPFWRVVHPRNMIGVDICHRGLIGLTVTDVDVGRSCVIHLKGRLTDRRVICRGVVGW